MAERLSSCQHADTLLLRQLVAALDDGVVLLGPGQTIAWANRTALAMHGVERLEDLGTTVPEYRARFELRYGNGHRLIR